MPIKLADEHEALKLDVAATKLDGDDVFNKLWKKLPQLYSFSLILPNKCLNNVLYYVLN